MSTDSPLWPARLHHIKITSDQPSALLDFYGPVLELTVADMGDGAWALTGAERRLLIGRGQRNRLAFSAFAIEDSARVAALRDFVAGLGLEILDSPSPLFAPGAFALADPDGQVLVFGTPSEPGTGRDRLPGRLQHAVTGSPDPERAVDFRLKLGFVLSDEVRDGAGTLTAAFLRSDPEHHSQATFRTKDPRFDHFALETTGWNDIRDWADHLASMRIPLDWGPGRHGPGNNLFFMVPDPDGNMVEWSAELEHMERDVAARQWPHEEHTLNLWGGAWMRS